MWPSNSFLIKDYLIFYFAIIVETSILKSFSMANRFKISISTGLMKIGFEYLFKVAVFGHGKGIVKGEYS
jgi:hypothetical protein